METKVSLQSRVVRELMMMMMMMILIVTTINKVPFNVRGPGSSLGIATDHGLDGPGSNSGGDEIFRPSRPALRPTQPPEKWVPGLSLGKGRSGRAADLLVPRSWKSKAIPLPPSGPHRACNSITLPFSLECAKRRSDSFPVSLDTLCSLPRPTL